MRATVVVNESNGCCWSKRLVFMREVLLAAGFKKWKSNGTLFLRWEGREKRLAVNKKLKMSFIDLSEPTQSRSFVDKSDERKLYLNHLKCVERIKTEWWLVDTASITVVTSTNGQMGQKQQRQHVLTGRCSLTKSNYHPRAHAHSGFFVVNFRASWWSTSLKLNQKSTYYFSLIFIYRNNIVMLLLYFICVCKRLDVLLREMFMNIVLEELNSGE